MYENNEVKAMPTMADYNEVQAGANSAPVFTPLNVTAAEAQAVVAAKPVYEFRALTAADIFPVVRIIRKIGINKFKAVFENAEMQAMMNGGDMSDNGGINFMLDLAQIVLDGVADCENEIFSLLARVSNLSENEIKTLDMATFTTMIIDFFKKEELKDFLRAVFAALGATQN